MITAPLAGLTTQTRRILKPHSELTLRVSDRFYLSNAHGGIVNATEGEVREHRPDFSRFAVDNRLYVRENYAVVPSSAYRMSEGGQQTANPADLDEAAICAAGWDRSKPRWRPSIHMPRWASRLTLLVTDAQVERLQDIGEADEIAEGLRPETCAGQRSWDPGTPHGQFAHPQVAYRMIWEDIHGPGSWDANPWVVVVSFAVVERNRPARADRRGSRMTVAYHQACCPVVRSSLRSRPLSGRARILRHLQVEPKIETERTLLAQRNPAAANRAVTNEGQVLRNTTGSDDADVGSGLGGREHRARHVEAAEADRSRRVRGRVDEVLVGHAAYVLHAGDTSVWTRCLTVCCSAATTAAVAVARS